MARLLRVQFSGAIYHVTVRGNERGTIFKDDKDREGFLEILAQTQELHQLRIYLVCLMPNHFHLLLETPGGDLSAGMARLLTGYAVYFNRRSQRVGHLTQGRYKAQLVEGTDYLLKLSRYIHLNPVCGQKWVGVPPQHAATSCWNIIGARTAATLVWKLHGPGWTTARCKRWWSNLESATANTWRVGWPTATRNSGSSTKRLG